MSFMRIINIRGAGKAGNNQRGFCMRVSGKETRAYVLFRQGNSVGTDGSTDVHTRRDAGLPGSFRHPCSVCALQGVSALPQQFGFPPASHVFPRSRGGKKTRKC